MKVSIHVLYSCEWVYRIVLVSESAWRCKSVRLSLNICMFVCRYVCERAREILWLWISVYINLREYFSWIEPMCKFICKYIPRFVVCAHAYVSVHLWAHVHNVLFHVFVRALVSNFRERFVMAFVGYRIRTETLVLKPRNFIHLLHIYTCLDSCKLFSASFV